MDNKQGKEGGIFHGLAEFSHKLADAAFPEEDAKKEGIKVKAPETKEQKSPDIISTSNLSGPSDPKIYEVLEQALKEKGSLYGQFMDMVISFRDIIPDEKQRYKAALVAMQKNVPDLNIDMISSSLNERNEALELEHQKFLKSLDAQNARVVELTNASKARISKIESLKEQISDLEEEKKEIDVKIVQENDKITRIQQTFESTLAEVQRSIIDSRAVIQKHLTS